jgi:MFS family permease
VICVDHLITNIGYYTLIPIWPVVLTQVKGLSLPQVATVTFVLTFSVRSAQALTGPLLDSVRPKWSIVFGVLLTGFSFLAMGYVATFPWILVLSVSAGLGASMNSLTAKTVVAHEGARTGRALTYFSIINVVVNLAFAAGSLLGSYLLARSLVPYVFVVTGAFYVLTSGIVLWLLPPLKEHEPSLHSLEYWGRYRRVWSDGDFRSALPLIVIGWLCNAQLFSTLSYYVSIQLQRPALLGVLFTLNAGLVITLQLLVSRAAAGMRTGHGVGRPFGLAYLLFSLAFVAAGVHPSLSLLFLMVVLFTVGEMLFVPCADAITSEHAKPDLRATYFSILGVSRAVGEGLGAYAGLRWLGYWIERNQPSGFWLSLGALMGLSSLGVWWSTSRPGGIRAYVSGK